MKLAMNQVINLPKNEVLNSSIKDQIPESLVLPKNARDTYVFKDLQSTPLISLGKLCVDGSTFILDIYINHFFKGTYLVLPGKRNQMDGLWDIPLTDPGLPLSTIKSSQ